MGTVREETWENNLEGMATSISTVYPGCTKDQERSFVTDAAGAQKQSSWGDAGDELQVTYYFAGIIEVIFCIIWAKFASRMKHEVRGSIHSMIRGDFLDVDRKNSLLWWLNSLFFSPSYFLPSAGFCIELHVNLFITLFASTVLEGSGSSCLFSQLCSQRTLLLTQLLRKAVLLMGQLPLHASLQGLAWVTPSVSHAWDVSHFQGLGLCQHIQRKGSSVSHLPSP